MKHISYRLESEESGIWYNKEGIFEPFDDPEVKEKEMFLDGFFIGKLSGVSSIQELKNWFSDDLIQKLRLNFFKLYEIKSSKIIILENQVLIPEKSIIEKTEITKF